MTRTLKATMIFFISAIFILFTIHSIAVAPQPLDAPKPRINETMVLVHRAELAGATPQEVKGLVKLLNDALKLSEDAEKLAQADDRNKRVELLREADEILSNAQTEAARLEALASRRAFTNKVVAYLSAGIAALVATAVYAWGTSFWRKYRIRRTFQMKVLPR